jgi:hypothetical protein
MNITTTLDLLYLLLAISAILIGIVLTWLIAEAAILVHQANAMVKDTREKIGRLERAIMSIKEKLESSVGYLGAVVEGGKTLMGFMKDKKTKTSKGKGRKKKVVEEDEEEED